MTNDEKFMRAAIEEARTAEREGEIPIGAVVVSDGIIVGRGHNMTEALNDVTAHAEMIALTSAEQTLGGKYLKKCTLYVTIEPCLMCAGAIGWSQMGRVVFGALDAKRGYSRLSDKAFHPKTIVQGGILEDECASLMKDFFEKRR